MIIKKFIKFDLNRKLLTTEIIKSNVLFILNRNFFNYKQT